MTAYTKSTNFLAKDSLPDSDPGKIIKGSEFETEFSNLQTAVNSKVNAISGVFSGTPIAPTATPGNSSTQIATTAFVTTAVYNATYTYSTMASQAANAVAITGGNVTGMTALTGTTVTASTTLAIGADWTVVQTSTDLIFKHSGVSKMKLDSSGNITVVGDITAFGTI